MSTVKIYTCELCSTQFEREYKFEKCYGHTRFFCSTSCSEKWASKHKNKIRQFTCSICQTNFSRQNNQYKKSKSGNCYCSRSCSGVASNRNKTTGTRVSLFEIFCQERLVKDFNLQFQFNCIDVVGHELDIFIPDLKLAFELNGIVHYKPIYGEDKFNSIKANDQRKSQKCLEHNIDLVTVDVSQYNRSTDKNCQKVYDYIVEKINEKMVARTGFEPVL